MFSIQAVGCDIIREIMGVAKLRQCTLGGYHHCGFILIKGIFKLRKVRNCLVVLNRHLRLQDTIITDHTFGGYGFTKSYSVTKGWLSSN